MSRTAMEKRRRRNNFLNYLLVAIVVCIIGIIVLIQSRGVESKLAEYTARDAELQEQIQEEKDRTAELEEFSKEVQTDAYAEEQAQEKLKLLKDNQIMFIGE